MKSARNRKYMAQLVYNFKDMTRRQQLGVWMVLTALLAVALYRWLNLPQ